MNSCNFDPSREVIATSTLFYLKSKSDSIMVQCTRHLVKQAWRIIDRTTPCFLGTSALRFLHSSSSLTSFASLKMASPAKIPLGRCSVDMPVHGKCHCKSGSCTLLKASADYLCDGCFHPTFNHEHSCKHLNYISQLP